MLAVMARTTAAHKTAEAYLEAYLRELEAVGNRSAYTIRNYRNDIGHFLAECREREVEPLEVSRATVREYLGRCRERGMVPASITRRTSTIHGFYKYLLREGATERDLLYGIALPKRPKRLPKVLNPKILDALLAAPDVSKPQGIRDRAMFELLYGAGLRISELVGLDVGQLDLMEGVAIVHGKGSKERLVVFGEPAMRAVELYLREGRPELTNSESKGPNSNAEGALFVNRRGGRLSARYVQMVIKRHALAAGGSVPAPLAALVRDASAGRQRGLRVVQDLPGTARRTTQIYARRPGAAGQGQQEGLEARKTLEGPRRAARLASRP
jgi:site-specific recombinase XerD